MSKGILNAKETKELYNESCKRLNVEPDFRNHITMLITTINANVEPFNLMIKKAICETTGTDWYGLISTADTSVMRFSQIYSLAELELYKKLIQAVVTSDAGQVSTTEALNLAREITGDNKLTQMEAQDFVETLEEDRWIDVREGIIILATRSLLEMEHYIFNQFPDDAIKCEICSRICIKGQMCTECEEVKIHRKCAIKLFSKQPEARCPKQTCKAVWGHQWQPVSAASQAVVATPGPSQADTDRDATRKRSRRT